MTEFESFLAEVLPPIGLCPTGFNRRNIRRRVMRRMESHGIHDFRVYLSLLRRDRTELGIFRSTLTVTISRFFRNRRVFEILTHPILSSLAERKKPARAWSAGCASGEEPFTLRIIWEELADPKPPLFLLATDIDETCLHRAKEGLYSKSSLREVPRSVADRYFLREGEQYRLREEMVRSVEFRKHDLSVDPPPGVFDLALCRNAAFTYFDVPCRIAVSKAIASALAPGGFLVIGRTEKLPPPAEQWFTPAFPRDNIHRRR